MKHFNIIIGLSLVLAPMVAFTQNETKKSVPYYNIDSIIQALPDGARWIKHLNEDLLPFWMMKDAKGDPVGEFPSCRCLDGSIPKSGKVSDCPEYKKIDPGMKPCTKTS